MEDSRVEEIVERYGLEPHPEGGYYRETWRSERELEADALPHYPGARSAGTSILYLLPEGEVSEWHRFRSEEIWLHHAGNPVELSLTDEMSSEPERVTVGPGPDGQLQVAVEGQRWQRAKSLGGPSSWSLCACVVVPGFEFEDFEMFDGETQ